MDRFESYETFLACETKLVLIMKDFNPYNIVEFEDWLQQPHNYLTLAYNVFEVVASKFNHSNHLTLWMHCNFSSTNFGRFVEKDNKKRNNLEFD